MSVQNRAARGGDGSDSANGLMRGRAVRLSPRILFVVAAIIILASSTPLFAWGPGTHLTLASDLLGSLWMVPAAIGTLLSRNGWHYLYGTVAADVVFAKKLSRIKQICHHWCTGFSILDQAETEEDQAFAYGYLSHLAADTVAHNKYLPRQMALSRSTINFGHVYWELRADSGLEPTCWKQLRETLARPYPGASSLLQRHLHSTLLSFPTNKLLFTRMNLLVSMKTWRRSIRFWGRVSRWPLPEELLAAYRVESLERIVDILNQGRASPVLHEDPNGNAALSHAKAHRRQLRRMKRARMPMDHILGEAAAAHAPIRAGKASPRPA